VAKEYTCGEVKFEWTPEAFRAMQEGAEAYLVEIFQDAYVTHRATACWAQGAVLDAA
jgi:histone H3/H4